MQRKPCKRLVMVIASFLFVCLLSSTPLITNASGSYSDAELDRAVSNGFGSYRSDDPAVTYEEFFAILDKVVETANASKLAAWQEVLPAARVAKKSMTRYEGMVAVLSCAKVLGEDYLEFNVDWSNLNGQIGEKVWDEIGRIPDPNALLPNDWPYNYGGFSNSQFVYDWDVTGVAYRYAFGRASIVSGKTLFDYDNEKNSMRPDEEFLYTEALLAALRLSESVVPPITSRWPSAQDEHILRMAEDRKQAILSSSTTIEVSGTKYYVSNSGMDNNDGLSPDTAWATLDKVQTAGWDGTLKPGDGVFFERGGLWRGGLCCSDGITYSAYGQGEKPRIYGSPENGAGAEKWSLWYNHDGVRIWKFYNDVSDCGNIVFDDGDSYASRVFSYWNGEQALSTKDYQTPFDMVEGLEHDLQFYSTFDSIGDYSVPYWVHDIDSSGPIYLLIHQINRA